jgi:endonuclease III
MVRGSGAQHTVHWGQLLSRLENFYSGGKWRVPVMRERGADPFRVLVSTVLSHRTRDQVTQRAAMRLLNRYPNPTLLARANLRDIRFLIHDVGLSDSKARGLRAAAIEIVHRHRGLVPGTEAELRALPLVGKKTADAVLVFGFGEAAIPVDTHIHRVSNRLGVIRTRSLEETSVQLQSVVPRKYWYRLNPTLVQHGQNLCRFSDPLCDGCPIRESCLRVGVPTNPN